MTKRIYKERKLYYFACSNCGKPQARTFHKKTRRVGLCRKCKRIEINKNQLSLL